MARVSFLVLEGLERGTFFEGLSTPISIGREEDNTIQLNDERVSRFHAKVQEDDDHVILTDLVSTNGTRVNGHCIQIRVLQEGDLVSIGRCLLVYGSREQLMERALRLENAEGPSGEQTISIDAGIAAGDSAQFGSDSEQQLPLLFPEAPPGVPSGLRLHHQAQVSDMLAYLHDRLRVVLEAARERQNSPREFVLRQQDWDRLLSLEMDLACYLRQMADPPT